MNTSTSSAQAIRLGICAGSTFVLQLNFCAKNPRLWQAPKRYKEPYDDRAENMTTKKKILIAGLILITTTIIVMGLFDFLKPKANDGQFVSETAFSSNREKQMQMTPQTLDQLRKLNVTADKELKLEYFFYTNTADKAKQLATEIGKLNYTVQYGVSAGDKKLFIVTGWTNKMKMADEVVKQWTKQMCEIGYKFDCEFDGWGTEPDQE